MNKGLTTAEAQALLQKYGENTLTPPQRQSLWKLYIEKYKDPIIQILMVAALLSLGLAVIRGGYVEVIGIFAAIFFATTVGFFFEIDAQHKFDVLTTINDETPVRVRRNGRVIEVPRRFIVPGDIVLIEPGDEVPADGELIESNGLDIDESSLTGEPIAHKNAECSLSQTQAIQDAAKHSNQEQKTQNAESGEATYPANMVLRSTLVMAGRGVFRVQTTGDATEIGHVARGAMEQDSTPTPLNMQLSRLAGVISKAGMGMSILAFVAFLLHDIITNDAVWHSTDYLAMIEVVMRYFMMAVTLIVMAVPEGLPMAITLALALNMRRMLKTNNLVRTLHATETMGAVTVICTDKTGTLTENRMQVKNMLVPNMATGSFSEEGDGNNLLNLAVACNSTAELNGTQGIGNPTEVALLLWLQGHGKDYSLLRGDTKFVEQIPFSTDRKFMGTKVCCEGRYYILIKGAPEIVMEMCLFTEELQTEAKDILNGMQQRAMRTLAFAIKEVKAEDDIEGSLVDMQLQALTAIADPLRADVPVAVNSCRKAGIKVKIVTGDTRLTAIEIARQIGIWNDFTPESAHIEGSEWAMLSDEEAQQRAPQILVMSRARPADKQRLVEMLKSCGEIVAVTGDGTNDAPALNHAHVGLSLGSGTSVAKQASDMTLLDNSFASIVKAVEWGRALYLNVQRFLFFQLSVNVTALVLVIVGSIIGTEMPLTVTQILWVNLIMDTFAAMALSTLSPDSDIMNKPPRDTNRFIISRSMMKAIGSRGGLMAVIASGLFYYYENFGDGNVNTHELTIFFTFFVMMQFWNMFNAKALGTKKSAFSHIFSEQGFMLIIVAIIIGQVLIVQFGGDMFRTVPLTFKEWLIIAVASFPILALSHIFNCIHIMFRKKRVAA